MAGHSDEIERVVIDMNTALPAALRYLAEDMPHDRQMIIYSLINHFDPIYDRLNATFGSMVYENAMKAVD